MQLLPPPHSWASRRDTDVGIYHAAIAPDGSSQLGPAAHPQTIRTVYVFRGGSVRIGDVEVEGGHAAVVRSEVPVQLTDTGDGAEVPVLQGRPIGEPIVQYGPFVMNTKTEIQKAYHDYQETFFGGWPWPADDPNHGPELRRFARHADGRVEDLTATGCYRRWRWLVQQETRRRGGPCMPSPAHRPMRLSLVGSDRSGRCSCGTPRLSPRRTRAASPPPQPTACWTPATPPQPSPAGSRGTPERALPR